MTKKIAVFVVSLLILYGIKIIISINSNHEPLQKDKDTKTKTGIPSPLLEIMQKCDESIMDKNPVGYVLRPVGFSVPDEELSGQTLAQYEGEYYKGRYVSKKAELKKVYEEFVVLYKKTYGHEHPETTENRLQKIAAQEEDFERFIESYAEKNSCLYGRSWNYHYYGTLVDMIDLRIKHLRIHILARTMD
jgi:hypothetical protein